MCIIWAPPMKTSFQDPLAVLSVPSPIKTNLQHKTNKTKPLTA